jgi:uncharacterized oxidoreductase
VLANLSGHDSHGVGMVPRYVDAVPRAGCSPMRRPGDDATSARCSRWTASAVTARWWAKQAMQLGMERARQHGSCIMTLANAHHLGRIGHFAEMAVAQGWCHAFRQRAVAPGGGALGRRRRALWHQPVLHRHAAQGRAPFVLDFATSRVAQGKMRVAHNEGKQVDPAR